MYNLIQGANKVVVVKTWMFFYEVKANNENTRQHFYDKRIINKECKYRVYKIFLKMTRRSNFRSFLFSWKLARNLPTLVGQLFAMVLSSDYLPT